MQDDLGQRTNWGNVAPELLYGPHGWCEAAEPEKWCAKLTWLPELDVQTCICSHTRMGVPIKPARGLPVMAHLGCNSAKAGCQLCGTHGLTEMPAKRTLSAGATA